MMIHTFLYLSLASAAYLNGLQVNVKQAVMECVAGEFKNPVSQQTKAKLNALLPYLGSFVPDLSKCRALLQDANGEINLDFMDPAYVERKLPVDESKVTGGGVVCNYYLECNIDAVSRVFKTILAADYKDLPPNDEAKLNYFMARASQRYFFNDQADAVANFKVNEYFRLLPVTPAWTRFFESLAHIREHYQTEEQVAADVAAIGVLQDVVDNFIQRLSFFIRTNKPKVMQIEPSDDGITPHLKTEAATLYTHCRNTGKLVRASLPALSQVHAILSLIPDLTVNETSCLRLLENIPMDYVFIASDSIDENPFLGYTLLNSSLQESVSQATVADFLSPLRSQWVSGFKFPLAAKALYLKLCYGRKYYMNQLLHYVATQNVGGKAQQEAFIRWIMALGGNTPYQTTDEIDSDLVLLSKVKLFQDHFYRTIPYVQCELCRADKQREVNRLWNRFFNTETIDAELLYGLKPALLKAVNECIAGEFETQPSASIMSNLKALKPYLRPLVKNFDRCDALLASSAAAKSDLDFFHLGYTIDKFGSVGSLSAQRIWSDGVQFKELPLKATLAWILSAKELPSSVTEAEMLNIYMARVYQSYYLNDRSDALANFKINEFFSRIKRSDAWNRFFESLAHIKEYYQHSWDVNRDVKELNALPGLPQDIFTTLEPFIWYHGRTANSINLSIKDTMTIVPYLKPFVADIYQSCQNGQGIPKGVRTVNLAQAKAILSFFPAFSKYVDELQDIIADYNFLAEGAIQKHSTISAAILRDSLVGNSTDDAVDKLCASWTSNEKATSAAGAVLFKFNFARKHYMDAAIRKVKTMSILISEADQKALVRWTMALGGNTPYRTQAEIDADIRLLSKLNMFLGTVVYVKAILGTEKKDTEVNALWNKHFANAANAQPEASVGGGGMKRRLDDDGSSSSSAKRPKS